MSEQLGALMDALEQRAINAWEQLEKAHGRIRALEADNRALKSRLETLGSSGEKRPREEGGAMTEPSTISGDEASVSPTVAASPLASVEDHDVTQGTPHHDSRADEAAVDISESDFRTPQALLEEWYARFPKAFYKGHTQPLQVGIHEVLATYYPVSSRLLRRALACYVNLPRYLKSIRQGVQRVDLDGAPAGEITAEEEQHAREQLKSLQARQQQKKDQENRERMAKKLSALSTLHHHD
ncbi:ProQ/FINO family protein [Larsenimonas rhizosphaerae]|uniref:ProQ/FINO family protein n=1 Tax=Larsenimonas rhizosphaerae TaxID=2944682 RepID=UPI002033CCDB|nr:ProQ/FINO family protein [Larsenimonas rhizosphaerae]MCM2131904.1 ProQ/FinO family protein [Larsenimonas rhizosphaerae]